MKKPVVIASIMAVLALALTACTPSGGTGSSASLPSKVVIGTQNLADPEAIARAEGWLTDAFGVPVDIVPFDAGRDVNTAIASGSIDFGILGSVPAALAIGNGVPVKMVYVQSVLGEVESLVVKTNENITDAQGLIGKTIATTFSSTSHYSLLKYLEANNVDASSVDIVDMNASAIVAAFVRGDIDGAFTWEPNVSQMLAQGGSTLTSARQVAALGSPTMDVEIVRTDFATQYPALVSAYIAVMEKAVQLYKTDQQSAGTALGQTLGLTSDQVLSQVAGSTWLTVADQKGTDWFGSSALATAMFSTAQFLYDQGQISTAPTQDMFTAAVDGSFLGG